MFPKATTLVRITRPQKVEISQENGFDSTFIIWRGVWSPLAKSHDRIFYVSMYATILSNALAAILLTPIKKSGRKGGGNLEAKAFSGLSSVGA
jgi:hypothetical protein